MLVAVNVFVVSDVRARRQVLPVDVEHDIRPGQVQQIRVAADVLRMVTQDVTAVVGRGQPGALQHRAPRSVKHHDALVQQPPGAAPARPSLTSSPGKSLPPVAS